MLKVKAGNLDKLGLLFERYHGRLFSYFYRLTRRRDISEDLVQGVFERIIKYRHTYDNGGAFSTWIYRIARNIHADYYKKRPINNSIDDLVDANRLETEADHSDAETSVDEELELLQMALEKLDPVKKETLVLSRFQGLKYKEIAAIMGCTESAVKVRIYRAINELKQIVTKL